MHLVRLSLIFCPVCLSLVPIAWNWRKKRPVTAACSECDRAPNVWCVIHIFRLKENYCSVNFVPFSILNWLVIGQDWLKVLSILLYKYIYKPGLLVGSVAAMSTSVVTDDRHFSKGKRKKAIGSKTYSIDIFTLRDAMDWRKVRVVYKYIFSG